MKSVLLISQEPTAPCAGGSRSHVQHAPAATLLTGRKAGERSDLAALCAVSPYAH